ncbi:hypothetical protein C1752_10441 [Acaryochloris thomasi RCC1774]|uniref:Uncharacterized protein n=1 Tax=Acaryochloris thomasi RCC1774 TaxID=1764569 RepID=A0A2W1JMS9_9CYAN|nr:hypothetical protein [Acaryochloris thomasi]PZD70591.1 hypothetical protein C1752_10441 [Acaryochloris thomasi RCC1774]
MTNATNNDAIAKLTRNSLIEGMCKHASQHSEKPIANAKGLRNWVIATYYDETNAEVGGLNGFAHDLNYKAVSFRKREHCEKLFRLLSADASGLTQRKAKVQSKGGGRLTWAKAVRGVVYFIADHAEAAKAAVDDIPDSELKLTSMKSVRSLQSALQSRIESHSDDPVVTLRAEIYQLVGVNTEDDLRQWLKDQFAPEEAEAIDAWDFSKHSDLLTVQRIALGMQQQEA